MSISGELIGIGTAAISTSPIEQAWRATHRTGRPFSPSQFSLKFGFQEAGEERLNRLESGFLELSLHRFDDTFTFDNVSFAKGSVWTAFFEFKFELSKVNP